MVVRTFEQLRGLHESIEVIAWVKSLRYFTFLGAVRSGQMELPEELALELDFTDRADLTSVLETLGVLRDAIDGDPRVYQFQDLAQPGRCLIAGTPCFVWVHQDTVGIRIAEPSGDGVTDARVADARAFEKNVIDAHDLAKRVAPKVAAFPNAISRMTFPHLVPDHSA